MTHHPLIEEKKEDVQRIIDHLKKELSTLRTGKATPALVDHVSVEAYGVKTPLTQLAALSVPDPRTLVIQPWDKHILKEIEKALVASDLGVSPVVESDRVRLSLPPLTEESRKQLTKRVKEKLEEARVSLRRLRDDVRETIQEKEKAKELTEDDKYRVQRELDEHVHLIQNQMQETAEAKEKEIMTL